MRAPPPARSSAPSALRRRSRAARRRGGRGKGHAEIPTQGYARREVSPDFRSWPTGLPQTMITVFALWRKVITAFMAGFKNLYTCSIPAVVASVRIFESGVGREELTNASTEYVEKVVGRFL